MFRPHPEQPLLMRPFLMQQAPVRPFPVLQRRQFLRSRNEAEHGMVLQRMRV